MNTSTLSMADRIAQKRFTDMFEAFEKAIRSGDFFAPAYFAPDVKDLGTGKTHKPTVGKCISEALDNEDICIADVMQIVLSVANGHVPTQSAKELITRIADRYARDNYDAHIEDEDFISEAC